MGSVLGQPLRRVLCIVPPTGRFIREDRCQTPIDKLKTVALRPPIDLLYAAGSFEAAGCDVRLKDYPAENLAWDDLEREIREFAPQALVLSITTPSLARDLEAATLAKGLDPRILTIAKGAHFNTLDERTLEEFPALDAVLRGEYENTCRELGEGRPPELIAGMTWRDAEGAIHRNEDRPFEDNLDAIPFPARHLARNGLYLRPDTGEKQTTLVTNRGCPFQCIYCLSGQVSGTKNRYRSVANVMAEIRECVERHEIRNFLLRRTLTSPGDLDNFYAEYQVGDFASSRLDRPDRYGLLPLLDRQTGDWPEGQPLSSPYGMTTQFLAPPRNVRPEGEFRSFPQPQYWASCPTIKTQTATFNVVELDLGEVRRVQRIELEATLQDSGLGLVSAVGLSAE